MPVPSLVSLTVWSSWSGRARQLATGNWQGRGSRTEVLMAGLFPGAGVNKQRDNRLATAAESHRLDGLPEWHPLLSTLQGAGETLPANIQGNRCPIEAAIQVYRVNKDQLQQAMITYLQLMRSMACIILVIFACCGFYSMQFTRTTRTLQ